MTAIVKETGYRTSQMKFVNYIGKFRLYLGIGKKMFFNCFEGSVDP